jgi:hypothetical protein
MTDTLIHTANYYQGESLPRFFHGESWIAACLLTIFFIMVVAHANSRHLVPGALRQLFKPTGRIESYMKSTFRDFISRILFIISSTLIISLTIFTQLADNANISLNAFLIISAATLCYFILKYILIRLLGYIFTTKEKTHLCTSTLYNLMMLAGIVFLPVLTITIYFLNGMAESLLKILLLIIFILWQLILTLKIFQFFYKKILDFVYILLYLCTLEIIPIAIMLQVYNLFIRDFNF